MSESTQPNQSSQDDALTGREIAVIGMAGRWPRAASVAEFWSNLKNGVESATFFSDEELLSSGVPRETLNNPEYIKAGSLLDGVDQFDAGFFGYPAGEASILDPQQRLFLETAWHALEDAGYSPREYEGLIGVYAGAAWNTYLLSNLTTQPELFDGGGAFQIFIASDKDFMPTRVAYKFNLKGPSMIIQTSCSTSLVAIHLASLSLLNYECDLALAGGVTVKVPQVSGYFHQEGGLASPDGHCRPFDADAAGTIFGSGVGVVALKRLSDAIDDGDSIRAVIKGSAINNDGSSKVSYTAPSVEGQAQVIASAQAIAALEPESITYIETHGTGTSLGDPVEVTALTKVFRRSTQKKSFCAIGSVKSNIGHLDAAAGVSGFIKTVLALENKQIPPSINFERPNPSIDFPETPFYVASRLEDWSSDGAPRRAGVSSFGVGGTNAHVILEEAPPSEDSGKSRSQQLLLISARSAAALEAASDNLLAMLREPDAPALADAAYTLKLGRSVFRHRRAIICGSTEEAISALEERARTLTAVDVEEPRDRAVVFMFPGQGAQYRGMARGLYEQEETFRETVDRCARVLDPVLGADLRNVIFSGGDAASDDDPINQTALTQPALFVVEYALASLWMEWGIKPNVMIGHSIGEYVAACLAGVLSLEDALRLVAARGKLMQQQPAGAMTAVSMAEEEIGKLLPDQISVASMNEPSGCVISGPTDAMARFEAELESRDIWFKRLRTSHAFHSSMMDSILKPFTDEVRKVRLTAPKIPFYSNLTGALITPRQATDPGYWSEHLRRAVRFSTGLRALLADQDRILLEVGPGRVLTTLATRHAEAHGHAIVPSLPGPKEEASDTRAMLEACGRLWLAGVKFDWRGFYKEERRLRVPLPGYPFERQSFWIEARPRVSQGTASASPLLGSTKKANLSEWFYLPSWKPSLPPPATRTERTSQLVFLDRSGFAAALASRLKDEGSDVLTVEMGAKFGKPADGRYTIRPGDPADYRELLSDLSDSGKLPTSIVHAFSLGDAESSEYLNGPDKDMDENLAEDLDENLERGFYSLLFLLQALDSHSHGCEIAVLSDSMMACSDDEDVVPGKAPLLGLCRVASQELRGIVPRVLDIKAGIKSNIRADIKTDIGAAKFAGVSGLVDAVFGELRSEPRDLVVAYRGRKRWLPGFEPVKLEGIGLTEEGEAVPGLRHRGVYAITGGLSGNGLALAKYFARAANAKLILIERATAEKSAADNNADNGAEDGPRNEESRSSSRYEAAIRSINALGAETFAALIDTSNPDQLKRAIQEGESRFGELHGFIHAEEAARENAFRAILEAGRDDCEHHFGPKARSLYAIEAALAGRKLDFRVLLSSLASALGGVGYGPYTAASLFMDSFVKRPGRDGETPWLVLNWDLWSSEDNPDQITELRGDLSALAMSAREGEEIFSRALSAKSAGQIIISTADLRARIAFMEERFAALRSGRPARQDSAAAGALHPRPELPTPYVAPESELEQKIALVWQSVLGFERVGVEDSFFDLGGDSLIAIQVASRLKQELRIDFPVARLYQGVTVRSLAQLLGENADEGKGRRAAELEEHKKVMVRRRDYMERRRAANREMEG